MLHEKIQNIIKNFRVWRIEGFVVTLDGYEPLYIIFEHITERVRYELSEIDQLTPRKVATDLGLRYY